MVYNPALYDVPIEGARPTASGPNAMQSMTPEQRKTAGQNILQLATGLNLGADNIFEVYQPPPLTLPFDAGKAAVNLAGEISGAFSEDEAPVKLAKPPQLADTAAAPLEAPPEDPALGRLALINKMVGHGGKSPTIDRATPISMAQGEALARTGEQLIRDRQARVAEIQEDVAMATTAKETARANFHNKVVESRKKQDIVLQEQKDAVLYPNAPTGRNVTEWVAEQKMVLEDSVMSPEAKEQAQKNLDKAANPDAMEEVMGGSIWRTALSAIALAMGGFAAGMGGGPNVAADIIFKTIKERRQTNKDKATRKQQALKGQAARGELDIAREHEDYMSAQQGMIHDLQMYDMALEEVGKRFNDEATILQIQQTREQVNTQLEQWKQDYDLRAATSEASLALKHKGLNLQRSSLKMKALASVGSNPTGFSGLLYKKGAPKLELSERKEVREAKISYNSAKRHMDKLVQMAENMGPTDYLGWTENAKRMNAEFGAMIDVIRSTKGWGARFEDTEMNVLIPAYLGKAKPADFGYFLENLKATRAGFEHSYKDTIDVYDMVDPKMGDAEDAAAFKDWLRSQVSQSDIDDAQAKYDARRPRRQRQELAEDEE